MAQVDEARLRSSDRRDAAIYLQSLVAAAPTQHQIAALTTQLNAAVASGTLPTHVFIIYMSITKKHDFGPVLQGLQQSHTISIRHAAIRELRRALRRDRDFNRAWQTLGGASGLTRLMKDFGVSDVSYLCRELGRTLGTTAARRDRQQAITALINTLQSPGDTTMDLDDPALHDPRPLQPFYDALIPGADLDLVRQFETASKNPFGKRVQTCLVQSDPRHYQELFLAKIFAKHEDVSTTSNKHGQSDLMMKDGAALFRPDLQFAEKLVQTLADADPKTIRVPSDTMEELINPLLKRLLHSPQRKQDLTRVFSLIVEAMAVHKDLARRNIHTRKPGLFNLALTRWKRAVDAEQSSFWLGQVGALTALMPRTNLSDLYAIADFVNGVELQKRYTILRTLLLKHQKYRLAIDSASDAFIERCRELKKDKLNTWPTSLFSHTLDNQDGLKLFQKLWQAYPGGDFLGPSREPTAYSALSQNCKGSFRPDPETLNCFLLRRQKDFSTFDDAWLIHARSSMEARRKKAEQSREAEERGYWAKSAINLSITAGDLETYSELVVWARRFLKDSAAVDSICGQALLYTTENISLLSGFPEIIPAEKTLRGEVVLQKLDSTSELAHAASAGNNIMMRLLETSITMAVQPKISAAHTRCLQELPAKVLQHRVEHLPDLRRTLGMTDSDVNELVWKPSIDMLSAASTLARDKHADKQSIDFIAVAITISRSLATAINPLALYELVTYCLEKAKQEPAGLQQLSNDVLYLIQALAESDRPTLACSLISNIILGEDDNSAWYRQLLKPSFLSRLPACAAREFICLLADNLKEKMCTQNNLNAEARQMKATKEGDPGEQGQKETSPLVKVTTIKMIAHILRNATFIDHEAACQILIGILPHARHVDILVALTQSMLATLSHRATTAEMRVRIMDAIEMYVVPVAGRLDERRFMSEKDWLAAEDPKVSPPDINPDHTVMNMLMNCVTDQKLLASETERVSGWVFSAFEQHVASNAAWMALYMKKSGMDTAGLPQDFFLSAGPVNLDMLREICSRFAASMPASAFDIVKKVAAVNIAPPEVIVELSKTIRESPIKANSTGGKHWLAHYDLGPDALNSGTYQCAQALLMDVGRGELGHPQEVLTRLQDVVLEAAKALTDAGHVEALQTLVGASKLGSPFHNGLRECWKRNVRPIYPQLIGYIESKRTEAWQSDHAVAPRTLPDTFWLQLRMLPLPEMGHDEPDLQASEELVTEVSTLIEQLAARPLPYHANWKLLKDHVTAVATGDFNIRFLALGSLQGVDLRQPTLVDYLKKELAFHHLGGAWWKIEGTGERVLVLLREWEHCRVEAWRSMAIQEIQRWEAALKKCSPTERGGQAYGGRLSDMIMRL